jgi:hypothetical protein
MADKSDTTGIMHEKERGLLEKLTESTREVFLEAHRDYQLMIASYNRQIRQLRKQWEKTECSGSNSDSQEKEKKYSQLP